MPKASSASYLPVHALSSVSDKSQRSRPSFPRSGCQSATYSFLFLIGVVIDIKTIPYSNAKSPEILPKIRSFENFHVRTFKVLHFCVRLQPQRLNILLSQSKSAVLPFIVTLPLGAVLLDGAGVAEGAVVVGPCTSSAICNILRRSSLPGEFSLSTSRLAPAPFLSSIYRRTRIIPTAEPDYRNILLPVCRATYVKNICKRF